MFVNFFKYWNTVNNLLPKLKSVWIWLINNFSWALADCYDATSEIYHVAMPAWLSNIHWGTEQFVQKFSCLCPQLVEAAGNLITKCTGLPVAPAARESQGYETLGFIQCNDTHLYLQYILLCPISNSLLSKFSQIAIWKFFAILTHSFSLPISFSMHRSLVNIFLAFILKAHCFS